MTRTKHLADNAKSKTICLTPIEQMVLAAIELSRQQLAQERATPSEVVADALWHYWECVMKRTRAQVEAMLPALPETSPVKSNLTKFPKKRE